MLVVGVLRMVGGRGRMVEGLGCSRMVGERVCKEKERRVRGCMGLGCKERVRKVVAVEGVRGVVHWQLRLPQEQREPKRKANMTLN